MAEQLRWGILGAGNIAGKFAQDLKLTDSGTVTAIGSRAQSTADAFGDQFDVPRRHASYEALVNDGDVDAVYIATPHPFHHANGLLALRAGKHVLMEKAFTMNANEATELVETARGSGLFLMEAMKTRFMPHVREINRIIAAGKLGEIVTVSATQAQYFDRDPNHRLFNPALGGSALLDMGVYVVSFASMILGSPSRITSMVTPAFTGVDGTTSMLFGYESGAQAILNTTSLARATVTASIVGTDARIEVGGNVFGPGWFTLIPREGEATRWEQPHEGNGLRHEADEVARCISEGLPESPLMPLDETIAIMETMDTVLAQATAG